MKPTPNTESAVQDACKRITIFCSRLVEAGADEQDVVHGLLSATVNITSGSLDQSRRREFAAWLRRWAGQVESGQLDPESFHA